MLVYEQRPFFRDRQDAGKRLAEKLTIYADSNPLVLAIPRGGVPVGLEVARSLNTTFDVIVVRKIPIPWEPEAGYGAITDDGTMVLNEPLVKALHLTQQQIQQGINEVEAEIVRRNTAYRGTRPFPSLIGKTAILIDDGLASGFTMIAALKSVRRRGAQKLIVAAPVASKTAFSQVKQMSDDLFCLIISDTPSFAVASFYQDWYDLTDSEVIKLLRA